MVKIPEGIRRFTEEQGVIVVGTTGGNNLTNLSPRIFFKVDEDVIYWLDFFKHKSYKNYGINPWVTIAVFNKENLKGYQFRGTVSFISDEPTKSELRDMIIKNTLSKNTSEKLESLSVKEAEIIQFEVKVCYSLNPEEYTDMSIGSDVDATQMF